MWLVGDLVEVLSYDGYLIQEEFWCLLVGVDNAVYDVL